VQTANTICQSCTQAFGKPGTDSKPSRYLVVCGEAQFEDHQQDTLLNPTLIVDVLSESTEAYDRGGMFAHYRKLPSLMEYVLITQTKPHIEHYVRQPDDRWLLGAADSLHHTVHLASIDCRLALAEVYAKVDIIGE
jgi:Uma2 family endonuclease